MTTEELKKQQEEEGKKKKAEMEAKMKEVLPKYQEELDALNKKYGVVVEGFIIVKPEGIQPAVRIRFLEEKSDNPYDAK